MIIPSFFYTLGFNKSNYEIPVRMAMIVSVFSFLCVPQAQAPVKSEVRPRLVSIVVDQMRQEYLYRFCQ